MNALWSFEFVYFRVGAHKSWTCKLISFYKNRKNKHSFITRYPETGLQTIVETTTILHNDNSGLKSLCYFGAYFVTFSRGNNDLADKLT